MKKAGLLLTAVLLVSCTKYSDRTYTGQYIWGHEVNSVTLCDSKIAYWVEPSAAINEVKQFYWDNVAEAYQPMYLKFRGHLVERQPEGFEEDYDGIMYISDVEEYSFDLPPSCAD